MVEIAIRALGGLLARLLEDIVQDLLNWQVNSGER